ARLLRLLDAKKAKRAFYDSNFIEDALLILMSRVNRDAYLKPHIAAELTLDNGESVSYEWDRPLEESLPRKLRASVVRFKIRKGVLYHFHQIRFEGLTALPGKQGLSYFIETGALQTFKENKVYTPERLRHGVSSLLEVLNRQGYENAQATFEDLYVNDLTGEVDVTIKVREGLKSLVRSVREETYINTNQSAQVTTVITNVPYSKIWMQDLVQSLKATNYHRGYPDTTVNISELRRETKAGTNQLDLLAKVFTGAQITLGKVGFEGEK